jgi:hypothetical protein
MPLVVTISADQGLQLQATGPSSSSSTSSSPSPSLSSSSSDVAAAARVPNGDHHAAAHGISSKCQQQQLDLLLLPPLDVQWVWHCHCLNPVGYRDYCIKKYGRVINVPLLADLGSEMEAQERCKKLWTLHYPKEPFDIMDTLSKLPPTLATSTAKVYPIDEFNPVDHGILELEELVGTVARQSSFYYQVSSIPAHHIIQLEWSK